MKKPSHLIIILLVITQLSGCISLRNWLNTSTQTWVMIVDKPLILEGRTLHIRIKSGVVWEKGDEALNLGQQIQNSLQITIDQKLIPKERMFFINGLQFPQEVFSNSERLGSYYDAIDVYVPRLNLAEGKHLLSIEIVDTAGFHYVYRWEFTVHHV